MGVDHSFKNVLRKWINSNIAKNCYWFSKVPSLRSCRQNQPVVLLVVVPIPIFSFFLFLPLIVLSLDHSITNRSSIADPGNLFSQFLSRQIAMHAYG